jgi:hypothetical protein
MKVPAVLGVCEARSTSLEGMRSPMKALRATAAWGAAFTPEALVSNLRPGLPCWLAWQAVHRGWPLRVIVAQQQLERAPSDIQDELYELFFAASSRLTVASVFDRDTAVSSVPCVTIRNILDLTLPILDPTVVSSQA